MSGSWYSQPYRADGSITAEGLRNQLGRPALSLPTVLVRESAQNSWDAKTSTATVHFTMELGTVGPGRMTSWRSLLGYGIPMVQPDVFPLRQTLRNPSLRYLAVSDRGTKGLGGPTRADHPAPPGERNWLSFVLNSGEARDVEGGGGTYGYGKGVFFLASQVGAVVIYTRFIERGTIRTRLIASALCTSFTHQDTPFTGRHWWGVSHDDHCEPLVDAAAEQVARALGLPEFKGNDTGTTIVIIEPNLLDPTMPEEEAAQLPAEEAGTFLAEAMAWNLWPLALPDRQQCMRTSVVVDGTQVPVPDEHTDPSLAYFAAAYRRMKSTDSEEMWCKRPKRLLGRFGFERTLGARTRSKAAADLGLVEDLVRGEAPHHICLMRSPELVVRYVACQPTPHPELGYAGVVRVEDNVDKVFAKSEPPTHDAWIDSQLHGAEATYVRVLHRRIKERTTDIAGARRLDVVVDERPVGDVARRLGHLLAGVSAGEGAGSATPIRPVGPPTTVGGFSQLYGGAGGSAGGSRRSPGAPRRGPGRPRLEGSPRFVDGPDGTLLEQQVHLPGRGRYTASVSVVTGDGKLEADPFAGAAEPRIRGWRSTDGRTTSADFEAHGPCDVIVLIEPVPDATLDISVVPVP